MKNPVLTLTAPLLLLVLQPAAAQQSAPPLPLPLSAPPAENPADQPLEPFPASGSVPDPDAGPPPEPLPGPDSPLPAPSGADPAPVPAIPVRPGSANPGRTWSEHSPFNIWGGTRLQRSYLFTAATTVRQEVLQTLRLPDRWTNPVVIQLREPLAAGSTRRPPVWTTVSQVEGGFRIEITLVPRRQSVPGPLLRENLTRAVLADLVLSGSGRLDLSGAPLPPPDWLLHGTLALMDYRQLGRDSGTFSRVFRLGRVLSVQDIFNADPEGMDSASLTIYRVSCGALLMLLIDQPQGPENLARLLPALARGGTDHATLVERSFPSLSGSANSLSKWWSLQVATLSQPGMEEVRPPAETGQLLQEALAVHYIPPEPEVKKPGALKRLFQRRKKDKGPEAKGGVDSGSSLQAAPGSSDPAPGTNLPGHQTVPLEEYARIKDLPDAGKAFSRTELALTRLMLRAHPVYRPIIQEYQDLTRDLARGKVPKNLPATLERLAATRTGLAKTIRGIEDHLDWYEATRSTRLSGQFEDYLRTAEELDLPPLPRGDPVSRYLDGMEAEYQR